MSVYDLSKEQLAELKQAIMCQSSMEPMWNELCNPDDFVSDKEVYDAFAGVTFSKDDFYCA